MSVIKRNVEDFLSNPTKHVLSGVTLGLSDQVYDAQSALDNANKAKPGAPDPLAPPPTIDDAKKSMDKDPMVPKTYGRAGTIKNSGGFKGIAASTLNLSSNTLTGN